MNFSIVNAETLYLLNYMVYLFIERSGKYSASRIIYWIGGRNFFGVFVKTFKNTKDKKEVVMKCPCCNKRIDETDCSCGWCTFCGTVINAQAQNQEEKKE